MHAVVPGRFTGTRCFAKAACSPALRPRHEHPVEFDAEPTAEGGERVIVNSSFAPVIVAPAGNAPATSKRSSPRPA